MLNRRKFMGLMGTGLATAAVSGCQLWKKKKPNIVVLLTDDQRWDAMGCMGNPIIRTPNMDRLAKEGTLFRNHFVTTSICAPSRASILSGQYVRRHGIDDFARHFSSQAFQQTYPAILRAHGYYTGFIGKWGIGKAEFLPKDDFDFFRGFAGQGKYFHEINGKQVHLTRILADDAVEFLQSCPQDKPFLLALSFKAPHVQDRDPRQFLYDPELEDLYKDVTIPVPETADPRYFEMLPEFIRTSEGRTRWKRRFDTPEKYQASVKGYYRLITGVDRALGRIMAQLQKQGVDDNTVIIYTSDNGFFLGEHGLAGKWLMYEESIRVPLIIRDPRQPASKRGQSVQEMTLNIDIAPTILQLAGIDVPTTMQGRSVIPLYQGRQVPWRQDWFYEHHFGYSGRIPESEGVRTKKWKYIRYTDQDPVYEELFDLENDAHEVHNLSSDPKYADILERMRKRWQELRELVK